jgi:hypothetical protein
MPIPLDTLLSQMSGAGGGESGQFPLLPVGDVVPMGIKPGPFQGPTPQSADYMIGRRTDPQVSPISPQEGFWAGWAQRIRQRKLEEMGVPRG